MIKFVALAVIVLGVAMPLAGCADSAGVPDSLPVGDEAAIRKTLDDFLDALDERDYDEAATYVSGTSAMSSEEREKLEQTLAWMRSTTSGLPGESFDNVTIIDSTAVASYTKTTTDDDGSFSFSVEMDLKKEAGDWKIDLS